MRELTHCSFCSGALEPHWRRAAVSRCISCGLGFRNPSPSHEELVALYLVSWESPLQNTSETGGTDKRLAGLYVDNLARTLGLASFRGLRVLDFGAGLGAMSHALAMRGAEVHAVEPFGFDALAASGTTTFRSLSELPEGTLFDGIVCLDVIEHLLAPWKELADLRHLLRPSGWLCVSTLNMHSLNAMLRRSAWREARKAGHVVFFDPPSLETLLKRSGFRYCRRLRWFIPYKKRTLHRGLQYALQAAGLESALRYLAIAG